MKYNFKEVEMIETVTQFMGNGQYVNTGFSLSTMRVDDEDSDDETIEMRTLTTNRRRNLSIINT